MLYIGAHLSASKGFLDMGKTATNIGANTFQFFTRNPRGGNAKPLDMEDIKAYIEYADKNGIGPIVAHAPYTLNACALDEKLRIFARDTMKDDIRRLDNIPGTLYNFHPGSHVGQGSEVGVGLVIKMLNEVLDEDQKTMVLLETMAGKGSEVGRNFEELRAIIDGVNLDDKIGVCLDTCHIWDGGYDIVNGLEEVIDEFDRVIGLDRLKAIHMNDSKNELNSHKDRHEKIGEGKIGFQALCNVMNNRRLAMRPINLETPNELDGYAEEIKMLKSAYR